MFAGVDASPRSPPRTRPPSFLGFDHEAAEATVVGSWRRRARPTRAPEVGEGAVQLVFDRTPCYAEGGGQVGDAAR
jgi:alanyl-tRNA synthetase